MLKELLQKEEGKSLEFKENTSSLASIVRTVIAFANTSGGTIVIGIKDTTKKIVGLVDPLEDETRIINKLSDSVTPQLIPNIEIHSYRNKALIIIHVPYLVGPYYLKKDNEKIAYIRFGSTNRIADEDTLSLLKSLARNVTFDETPCLVSTEDNLDWQGIESAFAAVDKTITKHKAKSLGMIANHSDKEYPSNGGILLFGKNRSEIFPDARIRCVRFESITRQNSLDHSDIDKHLPQSVDEILHFIIKNTFTKTKIGAKRRVEIPQYPPIAIREAVINAIVHTDYSIKGSSINVAIFDDRIEITNPGSIPYGLNLEDAIAGSSRVRNRVIARIFHSLALIEQWGSGLQKIIHACMQNGLKPPKFEELGSQFRVTIYSTKITEKKFEKWQKNFMDYLDATQEVSTREAAKLWNIDIRNARNRLKKLTDAGLVTKIGMSKTDPYGKYIKS